MPLIWHRVAWTFQFIKIEMTMNEIILAKSKAKNQFNSERLILQSLFRITVLNPGYQKKTIRLF